MIKWRIILSFPSYKYHPNFFEFVLAVFVVIKMENLSSLLNVSNFHDPVYCTVLYTLHALYVKLNFIMRSKRHILFSNIDLIVLSTMYWTLLSISQGLMFSMHPIFAYVPFSAINRHQSRTFEQHCFLLNLPYMQENYIYLIKNTIIIKFMTDMVTFQKKYLFMKNSLAKPF